MIAWAIFILENTNRTLRARHGMALRLVLSLNKFTFQAITIYCTGEDNINVTMLTIVNFLCELIPVRANSKKNYLKLARILY